MIAPFVLYFQEGSHLFAFVEQVPEIAVSWADFLSKLVALSDETMENQQKMVDSFLVCVAFVAFG